MATPATLAATSADRPLTSAYSTHRAQLNTAGPRSGGSISPNSLDLSDFTVRQIDTIGGGPSVLEKLKKRKIQAVKHEDYDEAERLKSILVKVADL
mgnify:CR=1 FL=1